MGILTVRMSEHHRVAQDVQHPRRLEQTDNRLLPARVEVQVNLVDQHNSGGHGGCVFTKGRIEPNAPPGEVTDEGEHGPNAVAQKRKR